MGDKRPLLAPVFRSSAHAIREGRHGRMVAAIGTDVQGLRDRALLLVGVAGRSGVLMSSLSTCRGCRVYTGRPASLGRRAGYALQPNAGSGRFPTRTSRRRRRVSPGGRPGSEQQARERIDAQLDAAGWTVQDRDETNLAASPGVAIREFRMAPDHGFADYLLFVNGQAVGALEAKPEGYPLASVEPQVKLYSEGLPKGLAAPHRPLPFLYLSTGVETRFANILDVVDPAEPGPSSPKRRRNLSHQELEADADQNGVGELYRHAVTALGRYLLKQTTRSSLGFAANLEGSRKSILSLLPKDSDGTRGLRFQVYARRLQLLLGQDCRTVLPPSYQEAAEEGFFRTTTEVDCLAHALQAAEEAADRSATSPDQDTPADGKQTTWVLDLVGAGARDRTEDLREEVARRPAVAFEEGEESDRDRASKLLPSGRNG